MGIGTIVGLAGMDTVPPRCDTARMQAPASASDHPAPAPTRHTVAVGDVHGCGAELERLFAAIDADLPGARVVMVGDLFTKGPEPGRVVRALIDRRASGLRVDLVCGNHDLQLLGAVVRLQSGASVDLLPRTERVAIELLQRAGLLREATWILTEACDQVEVRNPRAGWTVLHGGIDPKLGLDRTPDALKVVIKALEGEPNWWDLYDGRDGLIIVGHRPVKEPIVLRHDDGRPYAINIDTGCAYGGRLTGYCIELDRMFSVDARGLPMPGMEVPSAFRTRRTAESHPGA